ncbi:ARL2 protein, partial [Bucco capensis]|nr:ARL2 protein [Bucco capensis]
MGLLSILKKMREKERELRLLVLWAGLREGVWGGGGACHLVYSPDLLPSLLGFSFKLNVWDVGGQSSLRSYWRNYFESTDGLVWVVDSSDQQRLQLCAHELRALLREE